MEFALIFYHVILNVIISVQATRFGLSYSHALSRPLSFLQKSSLKRGFFDAYDRSGEEIYDEKIFGDCTDFGPPFTRSIQSDWIVRPGWSYRGKYDIVFQGGAKDYDKPSWILFWKQNRYWNQQGLIKKDFSCRQTEMSSYIQLNGAAQAGLMFRARGTFDYWGVFVTPQSTAQLVRNSEGRAIVLKTIPCPKENDWYIVSVKEEITDVTFACGANLTSVGEWQMADVDEIADNHMTIAGLLSVGGGAVFRGPSFGKVSWVPENAAPDILPKMAHNIEKSSNKDLMERVAGERLDANLQDILKSWCPEWSHCAHQRR